MSYQPNAGDPHQPQQPQGTPGYPPPFTQPMPVQQHGKRKKLPWILAGVGVFVALCCGGTIIAAVAGDDDTSKNSAQPAASAAPTATATTPTTAATTTPAAALTTAAPTTAAPTTKPPKSKPVNYEKVSSREWKKIAKDPDAHMGETIVVYGSVTQFDAATGDDTFRANVGANNEEYSFEYDTNTILTGHADVLADLVEEDEFRANVVVTGSFSYDTQIGGETTVPQLEVRSIKVL